MRLVPSSKKVHPRPMKDERIQKPSQWSYYYDQNDIFVVCYIVYTEQSSGQKLTVGTWIQEWFTNMQFITTTFSEQYPCGVHISIGQLYTKMAAIKSD